MGAQECPLVVRGLAHLVEDRSRNRDLPNVVEQGGPTQEIPFILGKRQFLRDHIAERAYLLGVTTGLAVMEVECRDELDRLRRCCVRVCGQTLARELLEHFLGASRVADAQCELDPVRRLLGKRQIESAECGERKRTFGLAGDDV